MTPLQARREAVVRRHMDAENVHDFDAVIDTFKHPRYELVGTAQTHDGEAAVREYFRASRGAFPDQRNELISLRHADDAVIVELWLLGTHLGVLGELAPSGRAFRVRMTAFFLFEGEGLVCERVYFDSGSILRQITGQDPLTNKLELTVDARTRLRAPTDADAAPLYAIIDANRAHLRRWLPWVDGVTEPADTAGFLRGVNERNALGTSLEFVIEHAGELAGCAGYRVIDRANRSGEIGYWLREDRGGRGIMTGCCRALVAHGFDKLDLNRIVIAAATGNTRSRAIPERLGFRFEGVLRQPEWLYDRFVDHAVYSLLRSER